MVWNYDVLTTSVVCSMSKLRLCHSDAGLASGEVARSSFIRVSSCVDIGVWVLEKSGYGIDF